MNSIACIVYRYQCLIASSVLKHVADNFTFANVSHVRKVNVSSKTITLATIRHCRHSLKIIREWRKTQFDYRILGSNSNSIQFLSIRKVEFRKQKFSQTYKWNNWTFIATKLSMLDTETHKSIHSHSNLSVLCLWMGFEQNNECTVTTCTILSFYFRTVVFAVVWYWVLFR